MAAFIKKIPVYIKQFFLGLLRTIKNWFVPDKITIEDGVEVVPPKPIMPYVLIIFVFLFTIASRATDFSVSLIIERFLDTRLGPISYLKRFTPVDWSYWSKVVEPIIETIQMSFLGSLIGSILALPAAYLASSNITKSKFLVGFVRIIMSVLRTLPILIYASFFKLIYGLGALAGTVAIALFTFSIVTKMLYERIEAIDMGAFEAIQSTGASRLRSFLTGVMPAVLPIYFSLSLYAFEINIRYAAILGYVGAGGIGFTLDNAMKIPTNNDRLIVIILFIFVLVVLIENTSRYLRRKLG